MIGALWSPPHWLKITTGRLMNWDGQSAYDPIIPWGNYVDNSAALTCTLQGTTTQRL